MKEQQKQKTESQTLVRGNDEQVDEPKVTGPKATGPEKTEPEITGQEVIESETPKAPKKSKKSARWHFPNAVQCPRCRTYDTVATSTKDNKQYRTCRRGHCRHRYCVTGVKKK